MSRSIVSQSGLIAALLASTALVVGGVARAQSPAPMLGFTPASAQAERALEARFDAQLSAPEIRERLRRLAAEPNEVGAPHDKANAEWILQQLKSWGWDAHIETFQVLYPTPKSEKLELLAPGEAPYEARLTEPPIPGDASSTQTAWVLPAYLAYQGDGDVTGELVYVNYGMPADYEALARMGVDVKGKIVIVRYGAGWRGLKPKLAQEHGAIGCIIYSDPADDGYVRGDVYPKGGWRPDEGVQRGSVQDMTLYPGDPLTPGVGATADAKRLTRETATTVLKIPAIPISYGEAQHFLAALGGQPVPPNWRGALPITYHPGPGPAKVHLQVASDWSLKPIYDVVAMMKGSEEPNQWILRGNHHDGWVMGAFDPLAGQAEMLEEAKAIGDLAKTGWRPKRTLVYLSWDGEEPGLLGSTEWVETHGAELAKNGVLYVNTDTNGRGILDGQGSYSTLRLVSQVAADVKDPETGVSVGRREVAADEVRAQGPGASETQKKEIREAAAGGDLPWGALGSGSDYSSFVQHQGVASMNLEFGGENPNTGVYHSLYDDFEHFDRFGDPGYHYEVALAQTAGRVVLRAADAEVEPFAFSDLAERVGDELGELKKLHAAERAKAEQTDRLLAADDYRLAADPTEGFANPERAAPVPDLDFGPMQAAVAKLKASAEAYDRAAAKAPSLDVARREKLDRLLQATEQTLLDPNGLPGRPWYKHLLYAPGMLTGYGAKTIPGVREAIEGHRWSEAQDYIARTAKVLDDCARQLDEATALTAG